MVEWKTLGDICEILDYRRKPVSKDKRNNGIYPYYGANGIQDYVDDYIFDGTYLLFGEDGSVINEDKSPILHWVTGKIWVNNHAHVLAETNKAKMRYIYYSLQCQDVSGIVRGTPPKINQANLRNIQIPIPPLSEQNRIVGILDTFTESIENLKKQITERKKQYEYYRDQLLFCTEINATIHDVASFGKGRISSINLNEYNYVSVENLLKDKAGKAKSTKIPEWGFWSKFLKNDILIGNIRPYLRKIWFADIEGGTNGDVVIIRPNLNEVIPRFLFNVLSSERFFIFYNQTAKGGKMPRGEKSRILKFAFFLPDRFQQSRIVSILDTFEASIANLEQQLSYRQKQYEYYRNMLLTFDE